MKRVIVLISFLVVFIGSANQLLAQQRPINSLYMFDQLLINPAYAGVHVQLSGTLIFRNQWVNLEGAPKTFTGTVQSGFFGNRMGLGLVMTSDKIGVHDDINVYASYSYKLPLISGASLSLGLQAGFDLVQADFTKLNAASTVDNFYNSFNKLSPNFGAGVFYTDRSFYVGASVPYLLDSKTLTDFEGVLSSSNQTRNYFITVGNTYRLSKNFKIIPSTLIRIQEGSPINFDLSANLIIEETVGLGASWRYFEGLVWMFELKINENFHVGYAYDATTSALAKVSNGSHEIMVNYRIRIPRLHRGLECPSYF